MLFCNSFTVSYITNITYDLYDLTNLYSWYYRYNLFAFLIRMAADWAGWSDFKWFWMIHKTSRYITLLPYITYKS